MRPCSALVAVSELSAEAAPRTAHCSNLVWMSLVHWVTVARSERNQIWSAGKEAEADQRLPCSKPPPGTPGATADPGEPPSRGPAL